MRAIPGVMDAEGESGLVLVGAPDHRGEVMSQAVLDGIRDLLPTIRERADEAERLRVVPEASVKEIEETGFFRMLQPRRYDGLEADPVDFCAAVRDIASACGSTGWVSSVLGVHPWQGPLFPHQGAEGGGGAR